ncbi:2-dehydro-3-deoxygalactonokinase [Rhodoferax sp. WC2427]|uniref:2-dehydro-3-deoxygalactonokinase n=1 Tax=Rhodoferax sp. WC2427 TaxID=3234144 RepID=UPI00346665BF
MTATYTPWIGVDWGTTHRRGYALDALGTCTTEASDDQGALTTRGRHAESLAAWLPALHAPADCPVVMSGMVGSAFGWQEAPYLGPEVPLEALPQHLVHIGGDPHRSIVPGYCVRDVAGQPDVMRGEETQLLGAVAMGLRNGWFVLPGTHSKWVLLHDGRIQQLRTYMTGELFALLSTNGTLAAASQTAQPASTAPLWSQPAFADGVAAGAPGALAHQLFACRARVVTGTMPASQALAYLSGLLIGSELQDVLQDLGNAGSNPFHLIGSPALAEAYQVAARQLGSALTLLSPRDVILSGFHYIQTHKA